MLKNFPFLRKSGEKPKKMNKMSELENPQLYRLKLGFIKSSA